jgi:hypothetical protein
VNLSDGNQIAILDCADRVGWKRDEGLRLSRRLDELDLVRVSGVDMHDRAHVAAEQALLGHIASQHDCV